MTDEALRLYETVARECSLCHGEPGDRCPWSCKVVASMARELLALRQLEQVARGFQHSGYGSRVDLQKALRAAQEAR